VKHYDGGLRRS